MLKQSSSRSLRTKGFKLKHVFQAFALLLICLWLLYQVKQYFSYINGKVGLDEKGKLVDNKEQGGAHQQALKLGRKDLNPLVLDELAAEFQKNPDDDLEMDEGKNQENDGEMNLVDDETDGVLEHEEGEHEHEEGDPDPIDEDDNKDETRDDV